MYKYLACTYAVCIYTLCMPSALGGQTRALTLLKPELEMVVGHHMGAVN